MLALRKSAIERNRTYFPPYQRRKRPTSKDHKVTPKEAGLRTHLKNQNGLYEYCLRWCNNDWDKDKDYLPWPKELVAKFLNLPPTKQELIDVLFSDELTYCLHSQNKHRVKGQVPNPDKRGYMKWDPRGCGKLMKQDALKQKEMIERIIESRTRNSPKLV